MSAEKPLTDQRNSRIFGLDVLRAFAILLVVMSHGHFLLEETFLEGFPFFKMTDGVNIFFVLSGFLIGGILLKEINTGEKFGIKQLVKFWKRRWLRTLPNYYFILLLNYLVVYYGIIKEDIAAFNWTFLVFSQNLFSPFSGFFWESWSLSIEEWFYILTPLLLMGWLFFLPAKKSFLVATLFMISCPFLYRALSADPAIEGYMLGITFRKVVVMRLDSIAYGLLAAWLYYYYRPYWEKIRIAALVIGIAVLVFVLNYEAPDNFFYQQVIIFSLSSIAVMLWLPFAESIKSAKGIVAEHITYISKISYSMYLINLALVAEIIFCNFPPKNEVDSITKYMMYWIIVIVASSLLYTYFEKPILNWRDKKVN